MQHGTVPAFAPAMQRIVDESGSRFWRSSRGLAQFLSIWVFAACRVAKDSPANRQMKDAPYAHPMPLLITDAGQSIICRAIKPRDPRTCGTCRMSCGRNPGCQDIGNNSGGSPRNCNATALDRSSVSNSTCFAGSIGVSGTWQPIEASQMGTARTSGGWLSFVHDLRTTAVRPRCCPLQRRSVSSCFPCPNPFPQGERAWVQGGRTLIAAGPSKVCIDMLTCLSEPVS